MYVGLLRAMGEATCNYDQHRIFDTGTHLLGGVVLTVCCVLGQNADPVKRQRGIHVEREQPWEILFNFLIVLQQPIQQFIQWCISDVRTLAPPPPPPLSILSTTTIYTYIHKS